MSYPTVAELFETVVREKPYNREMYIHGLCFEELSWRRYGYRFGTHFIEIYWDPGRELPGLGWICKLWVDGRNPHVCQVHAASASDALSALKAQTSHLMAMEQARLLEVIRSYNQTVEIAHLLDKIST